MRYVVDYDVYTGADNLAYKSQRDITSTALRLDRPEEAKRIAVAEIAKQIHLGPGECIVVTAIRPT